jgi:hypothetical protein
MLCVTMLKGLSIAAVHAKLVLYCIGLYISLFYVDISIQANDRRLGDRR